MNKGIIVGRLVKDPELRYTAYNNPISNITLACNNSKDDTTFLKITIFDKLAEIVCNYAQKGDLIGCEYIVKNNNYEDKNGNMKYEYSFIANSIKFLSMNKKKETTQDNPFEEFGDTVSVDDNFLD